MALSFAFLLNAGILVLASGSFHGRIGGPVLDLPRPIAC